MTCNWHTVFIEASSSVVLEFVNMTCNWHTVFIEASCSVVPEFVNKTCNWHTVFIEASCSVVLEFVNMTCNWHTVFIEASCSVVFVGLEVAIEAIRDDFRGYWRVKASLDQHSNGLQRGSRLLFLYILRGCVG